MAARHRVFAHLAAALLVAFVLAPLAAAQPWQVCGNSGNYAANSTYQSNPFRNRTLFATGTIGSVPDIAYALALCRDINASACEACVTTAFQDAQQLCAFNKDAAVFYDPCYLRFSNQNFLATTGSNGNPIVLMNSQNVSSPVEVFDAAVRILFNATGKYAAANSSRWFATGEEAFDGRNHTIYGLVQCTPDMSPADCRSCLGGIIAIMPQYLSGRLGGRIIAVRCNFRYEVYSFFSGGSMLRLPAPTAPAPAPALVNLTPTASRPPQEMSCKHENPSICRFSKHMDMA